jgi:hemerythrin-like domain-containing protein
MADAMDTLIEEHRVIDQLLSALETFTDRLGEEPDRDRATVRDFAGFFSYFVDTCHHGKEENYLFPRMNAYGFSRQGGPVSAMLSEQGEGRDHLSALIAIGEGSGTLTSQEQSLVRGHALGYILRIQLHMKREDEILFPVARHSLPAFVLEELATDFDNFSQNILPHSTHDAVLRTAKNLTVKYPPKPKGRLPFPS